MSFAAAARELGVTPTAISHQIHDLEEACGQPLFRRRPRPLALTDAGQRLFPVLRAGFDGFAEAVATLRRGGEGRLVLRITTTNAFAHLWLVPRLAAWRAARPDIALELIGTDTPLDLAAGAADLAIRYARAAPAGYVAHEALRDRHWPLCAPSLLEGRAPVARAAELLGYPLVEMTWDPWVIDPPTWPRWLAAARRVVPAMAAAAPAAEITFREELHAIEALIAGQGIGLCSDVLAAAALEDGRLMRAYDLALPGLGFYLIWLPGHPKQAAIEAFACWMLGAAATEGLQRVTAN